jgi:hypothetical protein
VHTLTTWSARRWGAAVLAALVTAVLIGVPSDVIPNPVFGRPVDVTWWSYPVLAITAVLGGLLLATYVRDEPDPEPLDDELDRPAKTAGVGGLLSFFAVGCPTCNKLVVLAIGTTGALDWFAPAQPLLAVASLLLLGWALRARLAGEVACRVAV